MTADNGAVEGTEEWGPEDRRKHLDFIQAAIARMAGGSSVAKGWALTISTATFGYAGTKGSMLVCALGLFAVILFAAVDTKYLELERRFRALYDGARKGEVAVYDMNHQTYCESLPASKQKGLSWWRALRSWTVSGYYGCIAAVGAVLLVWLIARPAIVALAQLVERATTCAC